MSKRMYPFPYKTVANDLTLEVSLISIENITIQSPNTYPTYTLTLPPNDGSPGQILSTDGNGVLSWVNDVSGGTVTSVSATVPAWLSVTVSNPTTTPAIAITGTSTGTGTVTVLQNDPTITTKLTLTRTSSNGEAVRIHNAQAAPQKNYIEIGHNSNNHNHVHFGHNYLLSNDAGNYAYMQTGGKELCWDGNSRLFSDSLTLAASFTGTVDVQSSMTVYDNVFTLEGTSSVDFRFRYVRPSTSLVELMGAFGATWGTDDFFFKAYYGSVSLQTVANQPIKLHNINTGKQVVFDGAADFTFPLTAGSSGQSLITNGLGATSWVDRVSSVSVTVPSFMSVTVTNATTTPAIAISATSTGTGDVVLATSPTVSTPTLNNYATVAALSGPNDAGTLIVRGGTDVYITKYKPGAASQLNNAFMITTNPANSANTFFYSQGSSVGIFSHAPQETLDVQGSIRASNFIRFNNVNVYPGSSGVLSLYLPTSTGTSGQVLTSTGSGTAMTWTTPATGTVTSVTASSPLASSGGATPDISLSTVPTTLGGTGLTTVGTNGQVLTSNGTTLSWATPTSGTITAVTATSPIVSSGGSAPDISLSTVPTTLGGTGLTTVGTNGQVLTSNGTTLSWQTPSSTGGTVTSVSASVPSFLSVTVSNPTTTPAIAISGSSTGSGFVVLQDNPIINNSLLISSPATLTNTSLEIYQPNISFGYDNRFNIGKSSTNLEHGYITYTHQNVTTARRISMGLGSTTIAVNGAGQFLAPALIANTSGYFFSTFIDVNASSGRIIITDNTAVNTTQNSLRVLNSALTTGSVQTLIGVNTTVGNFVALGWKHDPTLGNRYGYINTNNVNVMTFTTGGFVGVGTSNPLAKLHTVGGDTLIEQNSNFANNIGLAIKRSSDPTPANNSEWYTYIPSGSPDLRFYSANLGADIVTITTTGNFGIGTTTPTAKLSVIGSGGFYSATNVGINFSNAAPQSFTIGVRGDTSNVFAITDDTAGAFRMVINTSGNVGIGTATPAYSLDINRPALGSAISFAVRDNYVAGFRTQWNYSGGQGETTFWNYKGAGIGGFWFKNLDTSNTDVGFSSINCGEIFCKAQLLLEESSSNGLIKITSVAGSNYIQSGVTSTTGSAAPLLFTTMNAGSELMRLSASGNLGIGTNAPAQNLDVNGSIRTRTSFTSNNTNFFTYAEGTFTPLMAIYFGVDFKVYPTTATAPAGRGAITVNQTIQNGKWIRMGSAVTVQVDIAYSYVIPALQTMADCYICIQIPDAIKPNNIGATGVVGYPMYIETSADTQYSCPYYVSGATLSTGGTTGYILFARASNGSFLQWDNNNKTGQRVSVTVTYQCSQ